MKENLSQAKNGLVNPLIWLFVDGHQDLQYIMCYFMGCKSLERKEFLKIVHVWYELDCYVFVYEVGHVTTNRGAV